MECPQEETRNYPTPICCTCRQKRREGYHPAKYRGCNQAKEWNQGKLRSSGPKVKQKARSRQNTSPWVNFCRGAAQQPPRCKVGGPLLGATTVASKMSFKSGLQCITLLVDMLKFVTSVYEVMTELNGTVSEEEETLSLTFLLFDTNGIWRQQCERSR